MWKFWTFELDYLQRYTYDAMVMNSTATNGAGCQQLWTVGTGKNRRCSLIWSFAITTAERRR